MPKYDVINQYNQWPYPKMITNLNTYVAAGGRDFSDPSIFRRKIWPRPIEPTKLKILVAGCGTNQAAIMAQSNPDCEILGVDLSEKALANHERLKLAHQLNNLDLCRLAVEDVSLLGRQFDYIVSTGVLHHLVNPEIGLTALREVLAPHGVISVMLYGKNRRAGVYMVQEALRAIGASCNAEGVKLARDVVNRLPEWHLARQYMTIAPDLHYDEGFVDTFLNARDRAYTVPEIFELTQACKLRFQSWFDGLYYSAAAVFAADAAIHDQIESLTLPEQYHIVDLLAQVTGTHRFLLCHEGRDLDSYSIDFSGTAWLDYLPHVHPDLTYQDYGSQATLTRNWHSFQLAGDALVNFKLMNGERTFRKIIDSTHNPQNLDYQAAVFLQLAEWDHIYCELPA